MSRVLPLPLETEWAILYFTEHSDMEVERNAKPTKMEREQRPQPVRVFDLCG